MLNTFNLDGDKKNVCFKKKILKYFVTNGNSTIQELAKEINLSIPTITKAVGELQNMGYVNEYGKQETGEGRRPILYGLNPDSGFFVGVEIKENFVNLGLMNFRGDLIELDDNVPCLINNTMESIDELCTLVKNFIEKTEVKHDKILNVTFCISGRVNSESGYSHTLYNFLESPLTNTLSEKININVSIENDTRAFAYGEYMKGMVSGEKDVLFINDSWGLGLGIIIDGELYRGRSGFAGEIGHMHVFNNDILCHCGKKGCLETEASGSALQRIVKQRIEAGESSILTRSALHRRHREDRTQPWRDRRQPYQHLQPRTRGNRWRDGTHRRLPPPVRSDFSKKVFAQPRQQGHTPLPLQATRAWRHNRSLSAGKKGGLGIEKLTTPK